MNVKFLFSIMVSVLVNTSIWASQPEELLGGTAKASVSITTKRDADLKPLEFFELSGENITVFQRNTKVTASTIDSSNLLSLVIKSPRLCFLPVVEGDDALIVEHLLSDSRVMQMYGSGKTYTLEEYKKFNRCKRSNERFVSQDPYADYMMYAISDNDKYDEKNFLGRLAIGRSKYEGVIEHARLVRFDNQKAGIGTEMLFVGVHLVQLFKDAGITIGKEGILPVSMKATARVDNAASWKSMEKVGFKKIKVGQESHSADNRFTLKLNLK